MRFSLQSICTRLSEIPHFFAASGQDIYSITTPVLSENLIIIIIVGHTNNSKYINMNYYGYLVELYRHIQRERGTVKCNWVNEYGKKTSRKI